MLAKIWSAVLVQTKGVPRQNYVGPEINSLQDFLSPAICYHYCPCSASSACPTEAISVETKHFFRRHGTSYGFGSSTVHSANLS